MPRRVCSSWLLLLVAATAALLFIAAASASVDPRAVAPAPAPDEAGSGSSSGSGVAAGRFGGAPLRPLLALMSSLLPSFGRTARTVAELAEGAPGNMSTITDAVTRAGLSGVGDPAFTATIFAPTNWAFATALVKLRITPVQLWTDKAALTNLLETHAVLGAALAAGDLKDGQQLKASNGAALRVHVDRVKGVKVEVVGDEANAAQVVAADLRAGKSIVHVVDAVLVPPKKPTV